MITEQKYIFLRDIFIFLRIVALCFLFCDMLLHYKTFFDKNVIAL